MKTEIGLPTPSDERIAAVLEHWLWLISEFGLPYRSKIRPEKLRSALSCIWIYSHDREDGTFTCELSGEEINTAWGQNIAGKKLNEFAAPDFVANVVARWCQIIDEQVLLYGRATTQNSENATERLILPLCDQDGNWTQILGISIYFDPRMEFRAHAQMSPISKASFFDPAEFLAKEK